MLVLFLLFFFTHFIHCTGNQSFNLCKFVFFLVIKMQIGEVGVTRAQG